MGALIHAVLDLPVLQWWMLPGTLVVGCALVLLLWWRRSRRRSHGTQLMCVAVAAVVAAVSWFVADVVWKPFADGIHPISFLWVFVISLVVMQIIVGPWRVVEAVKTRRHDSEEEFSGLHRRGPLRSRGPIRWGACAVASLVIAAVASTLSLNALYSAAPTLGTAFGVGFPVVPWTQSEAVAPHQTVPRAQWKTPKDMPTVGQLTTVEIPASDKSFHPRPAVVYLPPAAQGEVRPELPVLVLMAGLPGEPMDWAIKGQMTRSLDAYAAAHGGIAPIVVVVDPLGGTLTNTLCSRTPLGDVTTYLQKDVPAWIRANLDVTQKRETWAIGGISNGATCALQVVTRDPSVYGTALVMSGEIAPTLGKGKETLSKGFAGNKKAFEDNDPMTLMDRAIAARDHRYKGLTVWFSVGSSDTYSTPDTSKTLGEKARAAGIETKVMVGKGAHRWSTWSKMFEAQLPSLSNRLLQL